MSGIQTTSVCNSENEAISYSADNSQVINNERIANSRRNFHHRVGENRKCFGSRDRFGSTRVCFWVSWDHRYIYGWDCRVRKETVERHQWARKHRWARIGGKLSIRQTAASWQEDRQNIHQFNIFRLAPPFHRWIRTTFWIQATYRTDVMNAYRGQCSILWSCEVCCTVKLLQWVMNSLPQSVRYFLEVSRSVHY